MLHKNEIEDELKRKEEETLMFPKTK